MATHGKSQMPFFPGPHCPGQWLEGLNRPGEVGRSLERMVWAPQITLPS